jgi:hypothetical protein
MTKQRITGSGAFKLKRLPVKAAFRINAENSISDKNQQF